MNGKDSIKLLLVRASRVFLRAGYVFPVKKNRILLMSQKGKFYSCNPKYIYQYLRTAYPGEFSFVWVTNGTWTMDGDTSGESVRSVKYGSPAFLYQLLTAGVIVNNTGISSFLPKRKSQLYINTWHGGGAYKTTSRDVHTDRYRQETSLISAAQTDVFLTSSRKFTDVMTGAIGVGRSHFFKSGMPRNDLLVNYPSLPFLDIRRRYGIPEDAKVILYAPTYRDAISGQIDEGSFDNQLDAKRCVAAFERRFPGSSWVFCYRTHIFADHMEHAPQGIDVTDFEDMQELLCMAEVLITDYSSSIWDFALTGKPGFLFAPDVEEYRGERTLYTPIETWQYPLAVSNDELENNILSYDETAAKQRIRDHLEAFDSYETGHASQLVGDFIHKKAVENNRSKGE